MINYEKYLKDVFNSHYLSYFIDQKEKAQREIERLRGIFKEYGISPKDLNLY